MPGTSSSYPERFIKQLPTLSKARARAEIDDWLHAPMQFTHAIAATANLFASKEASVTPSASDAAKGRLIKPLQKRPRKFLGIPNLTSAPTVSDPSYSFTFRAPSDVSPVAETFGERSPLKTYALLQQTNFDSVVNKNLAEYTGGRTGISASKYASDSALQSYVMSMNTTFPRSRASRNPQSLSMPDNYFAPLSQGLENNALASNNVFTLAVAKSVIPKRHSGPAPYLENILGKPVNSGEGTEADDDTEAINAHKEESGVREDNGGDEEKDDEHEGNEAEQPTVITTRLTVLNTESSGQVDDEFWHGDDEHVGNEVERPTVVTTRPTVLNTESSRQGDDEFWQGDDEFWHDPSNELQTSPVEEPSTCDELDNSFTTTQLLSPAAPSSATDEESVQSTDETLDPGHKVTLPLLGGHSEGKPFEEQSEPAQSEDFEKQLPVEAQNNPEQSALTAAKPAVTDVGLSDGDNSPVASHDLARNSEDITTEVNDPNDNQNGTAMDPSVKSLLLDVRDIMSKALSRNRTATEMLERLQNERIATMETMTRLETESQGREVEIGISSEEIESLKDNLRATTEKTTRLETQNKGLQDQVASLTRRVETLQTENKRLDSENATNAEKIESLETKHSMTKYKLETKNMGLEVQLANLTKEMKELQVEHKKLGVEKDNQTTNITSLSSSVEKLKADNLDLRSVLRTAGRKSESKFQRLRASNNQAITRFTEGGSVIVAAINKLSEDYQDLRSGCAQLIVHNADQIAFETLDRQSDNETLREESIQQKTELRNLNSKNDALQRRIVENESELETLKLEITTLRDESDVGKQLAKALSRLRAYSSSSSLFSPLLSCLYFFYNIVSKAKGVVDRCGINPLCWLKRWFS
ncbi:hypothetical protein HYFRA_00013742 [Hymenoscyphus fraxineus]|uniref:Uncharacterized protein n=1 Tax=Hymenoscyphus fraxineus TaxID=746836 RepID=A0A9N9LEH2_9HELO|nr:hypothetical protein HYFRA_00013742 [Hymenoscyphus fraxineus]